MWLYPFVTAITLVVIGVFAYFTFRDHDRRFD